MFYGSITDMTSDELAGNAALCRDVLRTGYLNGFLLSAEDEGYFTGWLSDIEGEIAARAEERAEAEQPYGITIDIAA